MSVPAVYSKRLADGTAAANGTVAFGPVPTGFVWVVKDIEARGVGSATSELLLRIAGAIAVTVPIPSGSNSAHWEGMAVANPGEALSASAGSSSVSFFVSGYQLTVAPPASSD